MKSKIVLVALALFAWAGTSQAQVTVKPSLGISVTDFSKSPDGSSSKAKVGAQIGGSIAYGKVFYIESGLFYTTKNTEFTTSSSSSQDVKTETLIKGLRVPINLGIHILGNQESFFALRAFGGPSMFYVTSAGKDAKLSDVKRFNWGLQTGVGVDVWKLFAEASYEWSLTNVQKDVKLIDVGKHRTFYVAAGIRLNF